MIPLRKRFVCSKDEQTLHVRRGRSPGGFAYRDHWELPVLGQALWYLEDDLVWTDSQGYKFL